MFSAVHTDRSGRIVLASDYAAAMSDGVSIHPFPAAIPLPDGARVVALDERGAIGLDRAGRPRPLGAGRWAAGAILPIGHLRLAVPAYAEDIAGPPLLARAYTAVGADKNGDLVVTATALDASPTARGAESAPDLGARISGVLRERPSSRLLRQLARCAKDYRCRAAANAFLERDDAALPIAAPANERPPAFVSLRDDAEASPDEPAAFKPTADEIADAAVQHLERGGTTVAFGRACEGEALLAVRLVEDSIVAIRGRTSRGTVHLETNGSSPVALKRLCEAGLDSVAFRIISARASTFEVLHRPDGFRLTDVRASITEAIAHEVPVALLIPVLPGLTDRASELDSLAELVGELPPGSVLLLRNLAADPQHTLRLVPSTDPVLGMERALLWLRAHAPHVKITAQLRPLVQI